MTIETCPDLLTVRETAQLLRASEKTVYSLIRSGKIPSISLGERMIRVQKSALRSILFGSVA